MFSFVCKPFLLFLLISRQSLVSVVGCLSSVWSARQGFRAEYAPQEEDSDRNGLPLDLSIFKGYCTTFADEQRKGANDGIGKLIISQIDDRPISNITLQQWKMHHLFARS